MVSCQGDFQNMFIKQLSECVDLPVSTIRFYERQRLLGKKHFDRQSNGYRIYDQRAVERLTLIKYAQRAGFTLSEIRQQIDDWENNQLSDAQKRMYFMEKSQEIEERITALRQIQTIIDSKIENLSQAEDSADC